MIESLESSDVLAAPVSLTDLDWPLMKNNVARVDLDAAIEFLKQDDPILTQAGQVRALEREWSQWLNVEHSVFVNSGSSANLVTLTALKELHGLGEIIMPPLTWVSDVASVLQCGFDPVFVDIDRKTLGMDIDQTIDRISPKTKAVFLTHILGFNALQNKLIEVLRESNIPLVEDACESYGATFAGKKVGTFGIASNFSFYYAHHLSTIEGGMICTNDGEFYDACRLLRSHGMVREAESESLRKSYREAYPDLSPDFIFAYPGYNVRNNEINAVIGRSQLTRLDHNNSLRIENFKLFLENLDTAQYVTEFATAGSCNYAFTLVLRYADDTLRDRVAATLAEHGVEFRRGLSGGGNQLRQPYARKRFGHIDFTKYPNVEHMHFYGFYIGNYPSLEHEKILALCSLLNKL